MDHNMLWIRKVTCLRMLKYQKVRQRKIGLQCLHFCYSVMLILFRFCVRFWSDHIIRIPLDSTSSYSRSLQGVLSLKFYSYSPTFCFLPTPIGGWCSYAYVFSIVCTLFLHLKYEFFVETFDAQLCAFLCKFEFSSMQFRIVELCGPRLMTQVVKSIHLLRYGFEIQDHYQVRSR